MSSVSGENNISSFTLVELLIVIAILAILAAAVVIVINPGEMLAEARDSQRVTDIRSLKDAVDLFVLDNPGVSLGTSQVISISIPDTSATCANISGLPTLPAGWSYRCVTAANLKNLDSTGWLPINLTSIKGGSPLPSLPIDPDNTALTRYYQYIPGSTSGSYELTSLLESEKQSKIASKDGGTDPGRLEAGSDISLWGLADGLIRYWPLDGVGSVINNQTAGFEDLSGNGNNGTASNVDGAGMAFVSGKRGNGIQVDGVDDYIEYGGSVSANAMTLSAWIKISQNQPNFTRIIQKGNVNNDGFTLRITDNYFIWEAKKYSASYNARSNDVISLNNWHYVVCVYDGTNAPKIYTDGVLATNTVTDTASGDTDSLKFGRHSSVSTQFFKGIIDDVSIYNRALSAGEAQAIYNATK